MKPVPGHRGARAGHVPGTCPAPVGHRGSAGWHETCNDVGVLKVDFHIHTGDDPVDRIPYSTCDLIDRAAALGYHAAAITLHEYQLDPAPFRAYAADRGLVLIPGVERTIEGKHVLLINFSQATQQVHTFHDLRRLKSRERGLVIAPHAYYPSRSCLWGQLDAQADVFDAVEYNAMFTRSLNFNDRAVAWARAHGRPLVGNCDVHRLRQLGTTFSLVDAEPDPAAICAAVAEGRVQYEATPLSWFAAASIMTDLSACRRRVGSRAQMKPASASTSISLPQSV
jgi:predicted metal-dependent phosphoesterase TrpH